MANLPISALDVQTTLLDTDLMVVVDTTDHSMAPTGTDKQITAANFIAGVKAELTTVPDTLVPFGDATSDLTTDANFNYASSTLTAPTVKGSAALQVQETGGGSDTISMVAPASIPAPYTLTLPTTVGAPGQSLTTTGSGVLTFTTVAGGDVTGPVSSIDNTLVRFDGTTGKLIQDSVAVLDDAGALSALTQLNVDNLELDGNTISSTNTNGDIRLAPNGTGITVSTSPIQTNAGFIVKQTSPGVNAVTIQASSALAAPYSLTLPPTSGTTGQYITTTDNLGTLTFSTLTTGDVVGPGSAIDGDIVLFDGSTGKLIQDSGIHLSSAASGAIALGNGSSATAANAIALGKGVNNSTANSLFTITSLSTAVGNPIVYAASGQMGPSVAPIMSSIINGGTLTLPTGTDTLVARDTADILTNKTLISSTNTVRASQLGTTGADVNVAASAAPTTGQVLTATSGSTATWQTLPASGNVSGPGSSSVGDIALFNNTTGTLIKDSGIFASSGASGAFAFGTGSSATATNAIALGNGVANSTANSIFTLTTLVSTTGNPLVYNASGQLGPSVSPTFSSITNSGTITVPAGTDTLVARATTDTLTNKTITGTTNTVRATQLGTTGADVNVVAAAPPTTGQILQATSATTATWQTLSSGAVTSFQTSLSGLTPSSPTAGAVTLAGTLGVASGGTGATTLTTHGVLIGEGTGAVTATAAGTAGQILQSGGASADPAYSTATYPSTTTINQILYSSAANTVAGLATGNNGVLITSATGVPSLLANGTTGQVLTATTGSPATWAALPTNVASFSAGTTGFTPNTATTGAVTLGGTLIVGNGGTGQTSFTAGGILLGNGSSALGLLADVATGSVLTSGGVSTNPTWTAFTSAATASTVMSRDANANNQLNVLGRNVRSQATAAGTTTLTVSDACNQIFTGSTTQTVNLPDVTASNMQIGFEWTIINQSSGVVTVHTNSGLALSPAVALSQNQSALCTVTSLANNNATSWAVIYVGAATGGTTSINTLTGALTMSQIVAVNDAGSAGGSNSVQIGSSGTASSTDSISIGRSASATTGTRNIAIGALTTVSGSTGAIGIGDSANSSAQSTLAIGKSSSALDSSSIAIGPSSVAGTGSVGSCIAIGVSASATNFNAIAVGPNCSAAGSAAMAIGDNANAANSHGIALGFGAMQTSGGDVNSIAIGYQCLFNLAGGGGTIAMGDSAGYAITTGSRNTIIGAGAVSSTTTATTMSDLTAVGNNALSGVLTTAANGATAIGSKALNAVTSGAHNTQVGYNGGNTVATTTGSGNTFVGYGVTSAATVSNNTLIGYQASAGTIGGATAIGQNSVASATDSISIGRASSANTGAGNISIGVSAQCSSSSVGVCLGPSSTNSGQGSVVIGYLARGTAATQVCIGNMAMTTGGGSANAVVIGTNAFTNLGSSGVNTTGVGNNVGLAITTGARNSLVGDSALSNASTDVATSDITAVGYNTLSGVVTSAANGATAVGSGALSALTSGAKNTHVGFNASTPTVATTTGSNNTFVGYGITSAATVSNNTVVGASATAGTVGGVTIVGEAATGSSTDCVSIGRAASVTTGTGNIGIGTSVSVTGASGAIGIGDGATSSNNATVGIGKSATASGTNAVAIGAASSASGNNSVAIGNAANAAGADAVAIGDGAMNVSGGSGNAVAIGNFALNALNSSGSHAVGIGFAAGQVITTGTNNTLVGYGALSNASTAVATSDITALGYNTLSGAVTAGANGATAVGSAALSGVTSGAKNTAVGYQAGKTMTTGGSNVCIGYAADVSTAAATGRIAIGASVSNTVDNSIFVPTSLATTTGTTVVYNASGQIGPQTSSLRFKENIKDARDLTSNLDALRVVEYNRKDSKALEFGLIAEEVVDLYPEIVPLDLEGKPYSVDYARITVILLQEIKNLRKRLSALEEI